MKKTLKRGAESGEWPVPIKRGKKVYYKLMDLKEMFRAKDGSLDKLGQLFKSVVKIGGNRGGIKYHKTIKPLKNRGLNFTRDDLLGNHTYKMNFT